jgi:hypothetical protein
MEMIRREWPWVEVVTIWNLAQPQPSALADGAFAGTGIAAAARL